MAAPVSSPSPKEAMSAAGITCPNCRELIRLTARSGHIADVVRPPVCVAAMTKIEHLIATALCKTIPNI